MELDELLRFKSPLLLPLFFVVFKEKHIIWNNPYLYSYLVKHRTGIFSGFFFPIA